MDANTVQSTLSLIFLLSIFGLYVWSIIWAYSDAEKRGKSGCLVSLLVVIFSWPIGLIAWVVFRPDDPEQGATPADRGINDTWELKMRLKKATRLESRGQYEEALTVFREIESDAESLQNKELAQEAIKRLSSKLGNDSTG